MRSGQNIKREDEHNKAKREKRTEHRKSEGGIEQGEKRGENRT